jgi:hypothetical protein
MATKKMNPSKTASGIKTIKQDIKVVTKFDYTVFKRRFAKRFFDVNNKEDLKMYRNFITTGGWGINGCPFELEWPFISVPDMLAHKISEYAVKNI